MLTIGITSYNRGKYLDVLLNSLEEECKVHKHELILVDNFSTEKKVFETIESHKNIITHFVDRGKNKNEKQDYINNEYEAKNIIIERAKGQVILFLQDDLQYIAPCGSILEYASFFNFSHAECMTVNAVRKSTIQSQFTNNLYDDMTNIFTFRQNPQHFHTMGFFRSRTFKKLGKYVVDWPCEQQFWGHSEDVYDAKVKTMFDNMKVKHKCISLQTYVPLFVPVWNDPRGGYAFLRDNKRYGIYIGPIEGEKLLYHQFSKEEFNQLRLLNQPLSFVDVAKPIGWSYPVDVNGDQIKYPQSKVMIEGPISEINQ
jgi:glycosyltransferase involved in cell wall biosynthesis